MEIKTVVSELLSASDTRFYAGLRSLQLLPRELRVLREFLDGLQESTVLAEFKKSQRLTAVLRVIEISPNDWNDVIRSADSLSPSLRNTLAQHLPARYRRELAKPATESQRSVSVESVPASEAAPSDDADTAEDVECSTVLVLSKLQLQDANRALLQANGYSVYVWDTAEKLLNDLYGGHGDVCAFLLDSSVLGELAEEEQRRLITKLAEYSSFAWLRIDQRGLTISVTEVEGAIGRTRASANRVLVRSLAFQPTGTIGSADLEYISLARDSLRSHRLVAFLPGEIGFEQVRLLIAATKDFAEEERLTADVRIESVETRFLAGGASQARTALVRVNRSGRLLVAKLASHAQVVEEMERFREYIQPWDNHLRPRIYFHGSASLILFTLVRAGIASEEPAPMILDCLRDSWDSEVFSSLEPPNEQTKELYLTTSVRSTALLLKTLNMRPAPVGRRAAVDLSQSEDTFMRLEERGVCWSFDEPFRHCRRKAARRYARLSAVAVTHGDFHLRNVLLRGNEDVHLIDYAASGPGHPAVDLVRFELALFLGIARQVISEAASVDLQRAFSIQMLTEAQIAAEFPEFHTCRINRVAIAGCIAARDAALSVLAGYGGDVDDYIAVKCLLAWQNLVMHDRQSMMARSIITAVQPQLESWADP